MDLKTPQEPLTLRLDRVMRTSAHDAFTAFTDPAHLGIWFTTRAQADLTVGGKYLNGDGDRGTFLVIDPPGRVEFTWDNPDHCPGTVVRATFTPDSGNRVRMQLEHSRLASSEELAEMRAGWSWALDSLKSYLETGKPIQHEVWLKQQHPEAT